MSIATPTAPKATLTSAIPLPNRDAVRRFDLAGRVAWVCGGAGYLGSAVSRALGQHGAHVVVADLRRERAEALVDALRGQSLSVEARVLDVGDEEAVVSQARSIAESHGRLDVVVNMTCFSTGKSMLEMSAAEFDAGLRVTLTGAFLVSREAGRIMVAQGGGSIVHVSSMYGQVSPDPAMYPASQPVNPPDYGAAKAGVLQLVRYQAVQWAPHGVRVNAVVPGTFPDTARLGQDAQFMANLRSRVPMDRVGDPHELDGAVVFLASDASSYVTGTSVVVDGGWTAR